jgi:Asp-tRNA(Asn)/Glu-tRNA(Gln) amidotransferase A subunit family amidase
MLHLSLEKGLGSAAMRRFIAGAMICAVLPVAPAQAQQAQAPFHLEEATIASIHAAFASGQLTCTRLTQLYLNRIQAYNLRGPSLRAIITVNPRAMELAANLDRFYRVDPSRAGPLFCIPIVLKDNFDTADMPTSGGNLAMKNSQPTKDGFTVAKMRAAGALILAKANLQELARGGVSVSSLGGQVLNPYDLTRTPGGSSGGTGAAIAANLGAIGTGSDTGQSIRSPASANALVGVRPTRGLVSRSGVIPASQTQDEAGPIARSVTDAAILLGVMAGYDAGDPVTALGYAHQSKDYTKGLKADALKGARIGVLSNLAGHDSRHQEVNAAMDRLIAKMRALGARVFSIDLPVYDKLAADLDTSTLEAKTVMDRYFATLPANAPVKSFAQLVATKTSAVQKTLENELSIPDGMNSDLYKTRMLNRERLRLAVAQWFAGPLHLDALLYPHQRVLVAPVALGDQPERNGTLSNGTGYPAVTFPAGFSAPTTSAPLGVPIGAELLGPDFSEDKLLAYAFAFEQAAQPRKAPRTTPPLPGEP